MSHLPVLLSEVIAMIQPERGGVFIDATLGLGGHSEALLQKASEAGVHIRLIGLDQDPEALAQAQERLGDKAEYVHANFSNLYSVLREKGVKQVQGILIDLGVSSYQIDTPERGFSYQTNGPLDMRMNPEISLTAAHIINTWSEYDMANLFYKYGEERLSRKIARAIVQERKNQPFTETKQLADLLVESYPAKLRFKRPHPATRVFQALRIAVNQELEVLETALKEGVSLLAPGGIFAIISFHSLEDRLVKQYFREAAHSDRYELINKKPLTASFEEVEENSRSRSAKLRGLRALPIEK